MATVEECEKAFHDLAGRLASADPAHRKKARFDRSLSCTLKDLGVVFAGQLRDGDLKDIRQVDKAEAQVRMSMTSDDLIALVNGELGMASAWTSGRIRIDASIRDLLKLRNVF